MSILDKLSTLRNAGGTIRTRGLPDDVVERFAARDERLEQAVDQALGVAECWQAAYPDLWRTDEDAQRAELQAGYVNFYADDAVNPYVALGAKGPWIVTTKGAVLHDSGGYGMLGFGHAPDAVLAALEARGHRVVREEPWSLGRTAVVAREETADGVLLKAAASPRWMQGYAIGR